MNFIESLLGNPFLLFIIIAGLMSFFRRLGGGEQENKNQPPAQRKTSEQEEVDWREIFHQDPVQPDIDQTRHAKDVTSYNTTKIEDRNAPLLDEKIQANDKLQDRYEEIQKRKAAAMKRLENVKKDSPILLEEISDSNLSVSFDNITSEEAIKGIIWSEVLGKPKARRPL